MSKDKVTEIRKLFAETCNALLQRLRDPDAGIQGDLYWLLDGVIAVVCRTDEGPIKRTEVFVGDKLVMFYPDRLTQVKVGQLFHVGQTPYTVLKVDISDYGVKVLCGETTASSFLGSRMETVV